MVYLIKRKIKNLKIIQNILLLTSAFLMFHSCSSIDDLTTGSIQPEAATTSPIHLQSYIDSNIIEDYPVNKNGPMAFNSVSIPFSRTKNYDAQMSSISMSDFDLLSNKCIITNTCGSKSLEGYRRILESVGNISQIELLTAINKEVNYSITYKAELQSDSNINDRWQSFQESFLLGTGDCEDYAITKYVLLAKAGISVDNMFITVLRDHIREQYHAVLILKEKDQYFVLDNQYDTVWTDKMFSHYQPLYSMNEQHFWLHGKKIAKKHKFDII